MSQSIELFIQALQIGHGIEEYFKNLEKINNKYFCDLSLLWKIPNIYKVW